ncbi:MAG: hypothetical protein J6B89_00760 [Bacilli bacterium]|nr:hypothetical protein [Bacilli bacterium]
MENGMFNIDNYMIWLSSFLEEHGICCNFDVDTRFVDGDIDNIILLSDFCDVVFRNTDKASIFLSSNGCGFVKSVFIKNNDVLYQVDEYLDANFYSCRRVSNIGDVAFENVSAIKSREALRRNSHIKGLKK